MVFDEDELGLDPEDDQELCCPECGEPIEECVCEEEEDAATGF